MVPNDRVIGKVLRKLHGRLTTVLHPRAKIRQHGCNCNQKTSRVNEAFYILAAVSAHVVTSPAALPVGMRRRPPLGSVFHLEHEKGLAFRASTHRPVPDRHSVPPKADCAVETQAFPGVCQDCWSFWLPCVYEAAVLIMCLHSVTE